MAKETTDKAEGTKVDPHEKYVATEDHTYTHRDRKVAVKTGDEVKLVFDGAPGGTLYVNGEKRA